MRASAHRAAAGLAERPRTTSLVARASVRDATAALALASIEIASFEALRSHTVPTGESEDSTPRVAAANAGECTRCHAINREGGRLSSPS
ncbi:MAG: hypothetical protein H6721_25270 [Sandaracinus sp.]|nr:hypothetical protein [Sandaracinus sp.]